MIQKIIEFSATNRILVIMGAVVLAVIAVYTLQEIRLDALPDLPIPRSSSIPNGTGLRTLLKTRSPIPSSRPCLARRR